jgi:hypothetical protein
MAVMLSRGKAKLGAINLHLPKNYQGAGRIDALQTAK